MDDHSCSCHSSWPMRSEPCPVCEGIGCTYFERGESLNETFMKEIHSKYYDTMSLSEALQIAKETAEEITYEDNAHEYCHTRPWILKLIEAVENRG